MAELTTDQYGYGGAWWIIILIILFVIFIPLFGGCGSGYC